MRAWSIGLRAAQAIGRAVWNLAVRAGPGTGPRAVGDDFSPTNPPTRLPTPRPTTEVEVVGYIRRYASQLEPAVGVIRGIASEVRTHGTSRADVLLLGDDLVAVEAKLTDWRRALAQAVLNLTVVDRSYVAMWAGRISPSLLERAVEQGVGVIEVHRDGLGILVKASPGCPDATARARVISRLEQSGMPTREPGR